MRNKKIMSAVLAGAMGITLLAGCGSTASTTSSSSTTTASDDSKTPDKVTDVTLTVMTSSEDQDEATGNWAKTECEAFAAAHPEYNITWKYLTGSESDAKDLIVKDPENAPDVYEFASDQTGDLVDAKAISELGGDALSTVQSNYSKSLVDSVTYEDGVYGVPFTYNSWFMYYDKSKLSEDDVKSLDTMLSKGKVEFPLENAWYIAAFYAGNGCTFYGEDGTDMPSDGGTIDLTGDKATAVTKYLVGLMSNPNFKVQGDSADITGLGNGDLVALFDGNWDYPNVVEALGEENTGCAVAPTFNVDGKDVQMKPFFGSKAIGVNPNAKNQKAAIDLAVYLGGEDAQKAHFTMRDTAPCINSLLEDADVVKNASCAALTATAEDGHYTIQPNHDMGNYWDAAANLGKSISSKKTTADTAAADTEAFNTAVNADAAAQ